MRLTIKLFSDNNIRFKYAYLTLCIFISLAIYYIASFDNFIGTFKQQERLNYLTLLGLLISDTYLDNLFFYVCITTVFFISAIAWLLHLFLPLTPILTTITFTILVSIYTEHLAYTKHMYHSVNNTLIIFCAAYLTNLNDFKFAFKNKTPNQFCAPGWIFELMFYWGVITYTYSGIIKISRSGLSWTSGTPLQLWIYNYGNPETFLSSLIINNQSLAMLLQIVALTAEASCFLCLFSKKLRILYGTILVAFHLTNLFIFGTNFNFYGNIFLVAISFVIYPIFWESKENN